MAFFWTADFENHVALVAKSMKTVAPGIIGGGPLCFVAVSHAVSSPFVGSMPTNPQGVGRSSCVASGCTAVRPASRIDRGSAAENTRHAQSVEEVSASCPPQRAHQVAHLTLSWSRPSSQDAIHLIQHPLPP